VDVAEENLDDGLHHARAGRAPEGAARAEKYQDKLPGQRSLFDVGK
jgi:hypothetical protein